MLTIEIMRRRWPAGNQHVPGLMEGIVSSAPEVLDRYGIMKAAQPALVVAHMMGQFSEECGQGLEMIENLNYTAERLLEVFPKHFTPSMAQRWAHNPQMIGEIAYGGRMGNRPPPSTDGYDRRGQGLSQVTATDGFNILQKMLDAHNAGFNILDNPSLIISPARTFECGVADYIACGCLPYGETDNTLHETEKLNGGTNGLAERERQIALWKREPLGEIGPPLESSAAPVHDVAWVQTQLNRLGASPQLAVDGVAGKETTDAVRAFQAQHNITVDGDVGPETINTILGLA
jgi:putative chitinase